MKILYYSPHPYLNLSSPSGPGTHMREMIAAFRAHGHEVATCILGGEHIYGDARVFNFSQGGLKSRIKGILPEVVWQSVKDLNLNRKDTFAKRALEMVCEEFQPDLIYERGFYMMTSGVEVAKSRSIPHILEMNAPFIEEKEELEGKTWMKGLALRKENEQARGTDLMVVVSSPLKEYYEFNHSELKDKVLVTPNAIDPSNFEANQEDVLRIRTELGLSEQDIVVGFVGSIFPYHGVKDLLLSFEELATKKADPSLKLLIVGDGETLPELREIAARSAHKDQIIFTGNVPYEEVRSYISNMDITVLANSKWYCSPIKIFEYGAMEKAVVSIKTNAVLDVMENKVDGMLIEDPAKDLASALEKLVNDSELRNSVARSFHEKVMRKHTWEATAMLILDKYRSLQ